MQTAAGKQLFVDAFTDGLPAGLMVVDREYRIQRVNRYTAAWLKREPEEMVGQHCYRLIHHREAPCEDCPCAVTFRTGQTSVTTHTGLDAQGGVTHAELTSVPIRDAKGEVAWAMESVRDVSERERHVKQLDAAVAGLTASEEQLKRRNEELEILNGLLTRVGRSLSLPDVLDGLLSTSLSMIGPAASGGIFLLDETRRELRLAAHRALSDDFLARESTIRLGECLCGTAAVTGQVIVSGSSADNPGHTVKAGGPPHGDVVIPLSAHERVLGVLFLHTAVNHRFPPGRERLFEMMGRQMGIAIENAQLYQRTDADLHLKVAELTAALSTVEKERTRALESERSKGEFVAMVSHDLRSPLTVIMAEASDYGVTCTEEECRESRENIRHSARRMTAMISDLVDSARLESGALALQRESLQMGQVLRDLVDRGFSAADRKRLALSVEGEPPAVQGDRSWLERAILNVAGNALKFAPADTAVTLGLKSDESGVLLEVVDQGPGIPAAELPLLFQRFFRASNTRRVHGSGLGLNIARLVVEAHGGRIGVRSELGHGVAVSIRLPLKAQAANT
jgi:PAS domain S-box-containing protein